MVHMSTATALGRGIFYTIRNLIKRKISKLATDRGNAMWSKILAHLFKLLTDSIRCSKYPGQSVLGTSTKYLNEALASNHETGGPIKIPYWPRTTSENLCSYSKVILFRYFWHGFIHRGTTFTYFQYKLVALLFIIFAKCLEGIVHHQRVHLCWCSLLTDQ